ncbi:MAG: hypothetical protein EON95_19130 [Caulobacteraceae bacterium]|nr:hypothetical protein [Caulobacter sp.]RYF89232.1 MAG: hypothetical protein EON95_19130 [Caulobacteraceae bacterium]
MRVQRQVDVVLQNHTQELLAIEDGLNVQGSWAAPGPPKTGAIVAKQGSGKWTSISTEEGIAAEGFIRFSCTKGYIQIHWRLPREADQFEFAVHTPEEDIAFSVRVSGANYDFRVLLVTLLPVHKAAKK